MKKIIIPVGYRYNKLVYLHDIPNKGKPRKALFQCDCGNKKIINLMNVRKGLTVSCGCDQFKHKFKHGKSKTVLYRRWENMRGRCNNSNFKHYHRYGGRGITVCTAWNNFTAFENWAIHNNFSPQLTLDRINNNKSYSPTNCRWVNRKVQSANRNKIVDTKHKYIGVTQLPSNRWRAAIVVAGKYTQIGIFDTEYTAVCARDNYINSNNLPHTLVM